MFEEIYKKISGLIMEARNILIISHRKPDADTLGGAIALHLYLSAIGKKSTLACVDKPNKDFKFLPNLDSYVDNFVPEEFDVIFVIDAGASYMTNFHLKYENIFKSGCEVVNIDHHPSNDNFGTINLVDVDAPSVTVIMYRMLKYFGVEFDSDIATCLVAGIYGDTGGFMHSNTTAEVYQIAAVLMQKGARVADISKALFGVREIKTLRLWGKVLEKAYVTDESVVMSVVKEEDFTAVGSSPENLTGVIDYLNMVPDTKFALLLNEDRKGNVKGSFRTRTDDVDLSRIAAVFGGGGHPKASGFMVQGRLSEELKYTIVSDNMSKKSLDFGL